MLYSYIVVLLLLHLLVLFFSFFFFFNATATTEIYTLSLHDALPISSRIPTIVATTNGSRRSSSSRSRGRGSDTGSTNTSTDRKSTRLNSSHGYISYAVFCLKKKKKKTQ